MRIHSSLGCALSCALALLAGCASEKDAPNASATSNVGTAAANPFTKSLASVGKLEKAPSSSVFGIVDASQIVQRTDTTYAAYFAGCDSDACVRLLSVQNKFARDLSTLGLFIDGSGATRNPLWQFSPKGTNVLFRRSDKGAATANAFVIGADDLADGTKAVALPPSDRDDWVTDTLLLQVAGTKIRAVDAATLETKLELELPGADVVMTTDHKNILVFSGTAAKVIHTSDLTVADVADFPGASDKSLLHVIAAPNGKGFAVTTPSAEKRRQSISFLAAANGAVSLISAAATGDVAFGPDSRLAWVKPAKVAAPATTNEPGSIVIQDPSGNAPIDAITLSGLTSFEAGMGVRFSVDGKWVEAGFRGPAIQHVVGPVDAKGSLHYLAPQNFASDTVTIADAVLLSDHRRAIVETTGKAPALFLVTVDTGEMKQIATLTAGHPASLFVEPNVAEPAIALATDVDSKVMRLDGKVLASLPTTVSPLAWRDGWLYYSTSALTAAPPATGRAIRAISHDGLAAASVTEAANEIDLEFSTQAGIDELEAPPSPRLATMFLRSGLDVLAFTPPVYIASVAPAGGAKSDPTTGGSDPSAPTDPGATSAKKSKSSTSTPSGEPSSGEAPTTAPSTVVADDSSGGCSTTPGSSRGPAGFALAALLGLAMLRRRSSKK